MIFELRKACVIVLHGPKMWLRTEGGDVPVETLSHQDMLDMLSQLDRSMRGVRAHIERLGKG